jgi:hypothetical protein
MTSLRISIDTIKRDWRFAKLWLRRELNRPAKAAPKTPIVSGTMRAVV